MTQQGYWNRKIASAPWWPDREPANGYYRVIVELSGNDTREIQEIIHANHGKLYHKTNIISTVVAEVPFPAIEALAKSKQVKRIWRDNPIKII